MIHQEHPTLQIFVPDTLHPFLLRQHRNNGQDHQNVIGFAQRQRHKESSSCSNRCSLSEEYDDDDSLPTFVQVSLVAIVSSTASHTSSGYHDYDDEIVGEVLLDEEPLHPPPAWTISSEVPFLFITLRLGSTSPTSIRIERIILDGVVLKPNPAAVILLHYNASLLNQAHYLRHLSEEESGLPSILRTVFRPLPRDRGDILPLQVEDWPPNEVARDPFGLEFLGGAGDTNSSVEKEAGWNGKLLSRSMGIKQVLFRCQLVSNLVHGKLSVLACLNLLTLLAIDIFLGLALTSFLRSFPHLYSTLHAQVHHLLSLLLGLLNWLKGSPAGLKLNSALNSLLWRFFSYHLHLWANYIGILEPILSLILSTIIWVGPIGFTVQLALIKDLLSMATFHVYCLYIYATRLYHVLMIAIKSLGRLFLGRKWNPLRHRVDHVYLSISEMFLGALFFTIALFLAPTIIIYYVVFLSLRLPVLFVEWGLTYIVTIFNSVRLVTTQLILLNNPRVCDQVYLERVIEDQDDGSHTHPPQFRIRLQATKPPFTLPKHPFALVETISCIVWGTVLNR